jgi:hypothetical protein
MATNLKYQTRGKAETMQNTARRLFDTNKGDKARTITQLINLADSQTRLRADLIKLGATALVGGIVCKDRAGIVRDVEPDRVSFTSAGTVVAPVRSFAQAQERRKVRGRIAVLALLNFRLPTKGNKMLRNASAAEIAEAVSVYERQSGDMKHKAAWLDAVRARVPKGKVVEDVFDDRALTALFEESRS